MKINKLNFKKGFTLIELLVVVAIIGVLAAIVTASISSSKKKGADGAIKSELSSIKSQASLYYIENNNSYNNMFTGNNTWASSNLGLNTILSNLDKKSNIHTSGSSTGGWAAQIRSVETSSQYFCIDSTLILSISTSAMTAGSTVCP
jgi:prepilin-type N-terminal cleavage/methylation domain-containing protein